MTAHTADRSADIEIASGILVREIVRAVSPEHIAELLQHSTEAKESVIPYGGRRSLATGHPVGPIDIGLDLGGQSGILAYEPADLTVSVRAGTTLAEIQDELGAHGQELPIDAPDPGTTTIGGLVATGFAGPRRLRSGTLRDLLIGCEYVRGDGLLAKAGGMVVKNVSGFEIPRFLHGSWGALAVLTSVNLKVAPKPRADGTIVASFETIDEAVVAALHLIAAEPSIESCVVLRQGASVAVAARATGRTLAVSQTVESFAGALGSNGTPLMNDVSMKYWQDLADRFSEADRSIVMSMAARPRDIAALASRVDDLMADDSGAELLVSPGTGSLRLRTAAENGDAKELLEQVSLAGGAYVVDSAPLLLRSTIAPWGPAPEGMDLARSIKREFDPAAILNPGRLFV